MTSDKSYRGETQSRTGKMLVVKIPAEKAKGPGFTSPIDAEWARCSSDVGKWRLGLAGASLLVGVSSSASSEFDYETFTSKNKMDGT